MRLVWIPLLLATGCVVRDPPPDPGPGSSPGWTDPQGDPIGGCSDTTCGTDVCARDGNCYPAASVRAVHVTWTVGGEPANSMTCASEPDLLIAFEDSFGDWIGFSPVPCRTGTFFVDKLPTVYDGVELGIDGGSGTFSPIDPETGDAMIDLP